MRDRQVESADFLHGSGPLLAVAAGGGHLAELKQIVDSARPSSRLVWCTSGTIDWGPSIQFPYIAAKDLKHALALVPLARRILRAHQVARVVTTGSAIAIPFAVACKLDRTPIQYIESAARQDGLSVTGRLLKATRLAHVAAQTAIPGVPVTTNIFDAFRPAAQAMPIMRDSVRRVVVTLGTSSDWVFRSAISKLVDVLPEVAGEHPTILWQTGVDGERLLGEATHRLVAAPELRAAMSQADVVIGHAGVGTALMALQAGRTPLLLPRRLSRGEHTDDHQVQLARFLSSRGLAVTCEVDDLRAHHVRAAAQGSVSQAGHGQHEAHP